MVIYTVVKIKQFLVVIYTVVKIKQFLVVIYAVVEIIQFLVVVNPVVKIKQFLVVTNTVKASVDPKLRDQQAGFRRNRSCADQIASLRIIVEQSLEWNSPLYINFIDFEKAFERVPN